MLGYSEFQQTLETLKRKIETLEFFGGDVEQDENYLRIAVNTAQSGGTSVYWAEITAVTDEKNYVADIYFARTAEDPAEDDPAETDKKVRVWDIVDELAVGDFIPVAPAVSPPSDSEDKPEYNYECCQQLGAVG